MSSQQVQEDVAEGHVIVGLHCGGTAEDPTLSLTSGSYFEWESFAGFSLLLTLLAQVAQAGTEPALAVQSSFTACSRILTANHTVPITHGMTVF